MKAYSKYVDGNFGNLLTYSMSNSGTPSAAVTSYKILNGSNLNRKGDRKSPTPFFYSYTEDKARVGFNIQERYDAYTNKVKSGTQGTIGPITVLTPPYGPDYSETTQTCLNKIYDQIRGDGMLVIDALEGSQTLRMLRSTLNLKKFVKQFLTEVVRDPGYKRLRGVRKGKSQGQQRLDYVTGKWLEYRYGWTPLVNSIYTAADLLYTWEHERIVTVKARSGRMKAQTGLRTGDGSYASPFQQYVSKWGYRSEIELRFKFPSGQRIQDWTTLNPALIAWELLPLSFVADWVVNISSVLEHIENYWMFKDSFLDGWQSNSDMYDLYRSVYGETAHVLYYYNDGTVMPNQLIRSKIDALDVSHGRSHNRVILTSLPYSNKVRVKINIGAKRQLDAAALIHQLVGKKLR